MGHHQDNYVETAFQTLDFELQRDLTPDTAGYDNIASDTSAEVMTDLISTYSVASRLSMRTDGMALR